MNRPATRERWLRPGLLQLGVTTEELNRSWYERNTGRRVRDVQRQAFGDSRMAVTLDGVVEGTEAVLEAKFKLPWSFSEEAAAEKYRVEKRVIDSRRYTHSARMSRGLVRTGH